MKGSPITDVLCRETSFREVARDKFRTTQAWNSNVLMFFPGKWGGGTKTAHMAPKRTERPCSKQVPSNTISLFQGEKGGGIIPVGRKGLVQEEMNVITQIWPSS